MDDVHLKANHEERPIWVCPNNKIYVECFNKNLKLAEDLVASIAEPVSRTKHIHEYVITPYSLYAAASVGLDTENIIQVLDKYSKNDISEHTTSMIKKYCSSYGKVKLVLRNGAYNLETDYTDLYWELENRELIKRGETEGSYRVERHNVEQLKRVCIDLDYPVVEEYDFQNDGQLKEMEYDLRPSTQIRSYQEKCLAKVFGNGRARSGIIVLPCGAGKTLVGITIATTIKRPCIVLCTSAVSVEQWRQQFKYFTTIADNRIARFTSDAKDIGNIENSIVITTYTMVAYSGKRSYCAQRVMELLQKTEWGLVLFDEVHVVPANVFRKVITTIAAHTKIGLTATLVREDNKIDDLNFLIGSKLYEANWQTLSDQGHIARVQCLEVWCSMTADFYRAYINESSRKKRLYPVMNPTKFQVCQFLIEYHERRGDKIIVFSDNVYALKAYALKFHKPFIYGPTSQIERLKILKQFQNNPQVNTIFLSKVGDTSIDLPEATVLIQISSHYGSRRQEAQRLGRILRAKKKTFERYSAFFYTLVSKHTEEMFYSNKRQKFLIDQGYAFKVINEIDEIRSMENLVYRTRVEQHEILQGIIVATESDAEDEQVDEDAEDDAGARTAKRSLAAYTGGQTMAYIEYNKPAARRQEGETKRKR